MSLKFILDSLDRILVKRRISTPIGKDKHAIYERTGASKPWTKRIITTSQLSKLGNTEELEIANITWKKLNEGKDFEYTRESDYSKLLTTLELRYNFCKDNEIWIIDTGGTAWVQQCYLGEITRKESASVEMLPL